MMIQKDIFSGLCYQQGTLPASCAYKEIRIMHHFIFLFAWFAPATSWHKPNVSNGFLLCCELLNFMVLYLATFPADTVEWGFYFNIRCNLHACRSICGTL